MARQSSFTLPELLVAGFLALLLFAIVVPNIQRGRMTQCEADAPAIVRMLITDEIAYSTAFPDVGYAPNLSVLGGEEGCSGELSPAQACLIDNVLACPEGVGEGWCPAKYNSYRINIQTSSPLVPHEDFWISASPTPASFAAKDHDFWLRFLLLRPPAKPLVLRSYCGSDDGEPRIGAEGILSRPFSKSECLALASISRYRKTYGN